MGTPKLRDELFILFPDLTYFAGCFSVMTYDYHGQWDKQTGHVAPMYQHQLDQNTFFNVVRLSPDILQPSSSFLLAFLCFFRIFL